ncbi:MAG: hypothetical protein M1822_002789 [Bathelium mastoideum]|nr:MAG: hypothetical protein M1822_002789 [Bathelium mastoideum]
MSKPTIVCVSGAWHQPEIYGETMRILEGAGYPTIGLALPSVGANPPKPDFTDDVKAIRDCLTHLVVSEGKDVVLVSHSYTGMPANEAPVGLGAKERSSKGLKGGVIRLVFIMAFAMPEGFQPTAGGAQMPDWMKVDMQNGVVNVEPQDAKRIFYNDLTTEQGDTWVAKMKPQSVGVYASQTTYNALRYIPSTYVIGTNDQTTFTPEVVDMIIKTARTIEPSAFDVVETCDGGHCLMISRPDWLAEVLKRAAGEE